MSSAAKVVITGVGVVSPFGFDRQSFEAGLRGHRSTVGPIRSFDARTFPTRVAAEVPVRSIDAEWLSGHLPGAPVGAWAEQGWLRDRKLAFACMAAAEAWRQAGCRVHEREAALSIALGLEQALLEDFAPALEDGMRLAHGEGLRYRAPVDLAARAIGDQLGLTGRVTVHTSACAAGALAVAQGATLIERGVTSIVLAGGADSMVNPLGVGGMARLQAPSPRAERSACRPFDARRDGLAIGEGAALFVLEHAERAASRGATPLARVRGWGSSQDGHAATKPLPDGSAAARAMRLALERAGRPPGAIGWLNAHGTGTPLNDPAEARAIRSVFGSHADDLPVSSLKGAIGHLMAAAGAVELAASVMALREDLLPGTAHHEELDPECPIRVIAEPTQAPVELVLSNSFGFGGQNASVLLERCA